MKELNNSIQTWLDSVDNSWKQLPAKDSRRIVLYTFACYVAITLAVIMQVAYQVSTAESTMEIEHISNPVKVTIEKEITKPKTADDESE